MLLVEIIIPLALVQMELAMMFDLIPLRALLMLMTWKLDSLIKYFAFSMLIRIIICFHDRPLEDMLIRGFDFSDTIDNLLDLFNFVVLKIQECFFDFQYVPSYI